MTLLVCVSMQDDLDARQGGSRVLPAGRRALQDAAAAPALLPQDLRPHPMGQ